MDKRIKWGIIVIIAGGLTAVGIHTFTPKENEELAETEKFYDDIVDRVLANARDLDRIQKRKGAAKAFEESNKAFARYLDAECKWVEESYGSGTGSGDAILACRINLMKMRAGSLDAQFLSRSH